VPTNTPAPTATVAPTETIPVAGATGGTASFQVTLPPPATAPQAPTAPVPFTVTVGLPQGVTASAATCEVAGQPCNAEVVDASTVAVSGELPADQLAQQPPVTVTFTVAEPAAQAQPIQATACTVVGSAAQQPAGTCTGTQTEVTFTVAPAGATATATTAGVVVLPGTGTGGGSGPSLLLLGALLAMVATVLAALAVRLRRA
jgi:hypothetical protein